MSIKLIQSYVQERYFVSTVYRPTSCDNDPSRYYYETMVWEWDARTKERGALVDSHDSGWYRKGALISHADICERLTEALSDPEDQAKANADRLNETGVSRG